MKTLKYTLTILIINSYCVIAQDSLDADYEINNFIEGGYQIGFLLQADDFLQGKNLSGEPISNYQAARIQFGWQTHGSDRWQQIWDWWLLFIPGCGETFESKPPNT